MMPTQTRADRFAREIAELKIPDPAAGRAGLWLRVGVTLMVAALVVEVTAYLISHDTGDAFVQRDAVTLALGGVAGAVVGAAVFVRYSMTRFLRFWMARQSYDLSLLTDHLYERSAPDGLASADPASR
jgi:hypothetical protein